MRSHLSSLVTLCLFACACDRQPSIAPAPATSTATSAAAPPVVAAPLAITSATSDASVVEAAPRPESGIVDFNAEPLGAPSAAFEAVIGSFYIAEDAGQRGLRVDGSKWQQGAASAAVVDQAKRLYGDKSAGFVDGVKAFASFPLAILKALPPAGDMRISVRFYPESGRIDQGAGIAFGVADDGSYQGVRANALEGNLLYFKVVRGRRTVLEDVSGTATPTHVWHTMVVEIRGKRLVVELDGKKHLDRDLTGALGGRVGLWSKADSQILFDDFTVKPL